MLLFFLFQSESIHFTPFIALNLMVTVDVKMLFGAFVIQH